jgi:hypothetical protein
LFGVLKYRTLLHLPSQTYECEVTCSGMMFIPSFPEDWYVTHTQEPG